VYEIKRVKKAVDGCQQFWHHVGHIQTQTIHTHKELSASLFHSKKSQDGLDAFEFEAQAKRDKKTPNFAIKNEGKNEKYVVNHFERP
jgi:hypothetical protein